MQSKKGLSDVVTTVLIILLALAAVVIVWSFVKPTIDKAGSQLTTACVDLEVVPVSCTYNATTGNATFVVKKAAGDDALAGVKIIATLNDSSTEVIDVTSGLPGTLETKTFTASAGGKVVSFKTAGVVGTEGGDSKTCPESATSVTCD